jgi:BirA family biotin operon repressor/biotin-[acetyl-CoA-carboxylase] ligase
MTVAETILWRALRDRGVGAKFRRQVPIGPYIADFVCIEHRLVVELDSATYDRASRKVYDVHRDA